MFNSLEPLFAIIDLGSNSFHMLIVQHDPKEPNLAKAKVITKIKRKVRLASGLNTNGALNHAAMQRGLDCLNWFGDTLQELRPDHCVAVATATLRLANNAAEFVTQGEQALGYPIHIISGEQEANLIYQGASSGSNDETKQLVIDIGGASTEIILGQGNTVLALTSLNLGCVTWYEQFFGDKKINATRFKLAMSAAKKQLTTIKPAFLAQGWSLCFGASGTVQNIREILQAEGRELIITKALLQELKQRMIRFQHIDNIDIEGLVEERAVVFPSGIAILLSIFEEFDIDSMQLARGALREGLLANLTRSAINHSNMPIII